MGERSSNVLNLSKSALNSLKKSASVQNILDLKGKVVVSADVHKFCDKTERLTEGINQIVAETVKNCKKC